VSEETDRASEKARYIAERILARVSMGGKLLFLFFPAGLILIVVLLLFNFYISGNPELGTLDILALAMAFFFVAYPFARKRFKRESDFILFFFIVIAILLLLPMLLFFDPEKADTFVESPVVYYFLALPLTAVLNIIGIQSHASNVVVYFSLRDGSTASVGIALSCSGIYSFLIFVSAFIAFVLTEFSQLNRKVTILATVGIVLTYLANLLRMTLIIIAGYLNGIGPDTVPFTLLWTHKYIGEIIFIAWIALFWWLAFRYIGKDTIKDGKEKIDENNLDSKNQETAAQQELPCKPKDDMNKEIARENQE
ncbi:MAG: exosortase/archaeosortase family protein, partial [Thermoplasmata archaeon]